MKPSNPSDKIFIQARLPILLSGLPYQCLVSCPMMLFSGWYKYYPLPFQTWTVCSSPLRFLERRQNLQTFKCKSFLKYPSICKYKKIKRKRKACWDPGRENPAVAGDAVGPSGELKRNILFSGLLLTQPWQGSDRYLKWWDTGCIWYRTAEFNYGQESNWYS